MQTDNGKGLIFSSQSVMFGGAKKIIGYGEKDFYIQEIDMIRAKRFVIEHHYSKKVFNNSYIHLGCFIKGEMLGVLQFGHMLNNAANVKIIKDCLPGEGIELNRMVFLDSAERNTESKAIAYCIKYIRNAYKNVKWIQSFADERCGKFGIVYQAANFGYYGEHRGDFYEYQGEYYHEIALTKDRKKAGVKGAKLREIKDQLTKVNFRQFRYLYFIGRDIKDRCLLTQLEYPKHYLKEWTAVVSLLDCEIVEDEFICPSCNIEYSECSCPGPMQEDEYEYRIINGVLLAKRLAVA